MELIISFFFVGEENPACTGDKEEIPLKKLGKYLLLSLSLFPPGKNTFCYYDHVANCQGNMVTKVTTDSNL